MLWWLGLPGMPLAALLEHYWARRSRNRLWRHSAAPRARLGQTPKQAVYRVSMGDIRRVSSSSMYGARGMAGTSFLGRTGQKKPNLGSGTQFYVQQLLFFWHSGGDLCPLN